MIKILMQEKMMNPMLYNPQYSMINQMAPPGYSYSHPNQLHNFSYPLSYSQVSSQNHYLPQHPNHLQEHPSPPIHTLSQSQIQNSTASLKQPQKCE